MCHMRRRRRRIHVSYEEEEVHQLPLHVCSMCLYACTYSRVCVRERERVS